MLPRSLDQSARHGRQCSLDFIPGLLNPRPWAPASPSDGRESLCRPFCLLTLVSSGAGTDQAALLRDSVSWQRLCFRQPRCLWPSEYVHPEINKRFTVGEDGETPPAGLCSLLDGSIGVCFSTVQSNAGVAGVLPGMPTLFRTRAKPSCENRRNCAGLSSVTQEGIRSRA